MPRTEIGVLELKTRLTNDGIRGALAWLNRCTQYRFTSLCLVDNGELKTVYLYDRLYPDNKFYTRDSTGNAYCQLILTTGKAIVITDSLQDVRVINHPSRHAVRAYWGFPLRRADGSVFGAICHFDDQPKKINQREQDMFNAASKMLSDTLGQIAAL